MKKPLSLERWHGLRGWRVGVALSAALSTAVLVANLLLTLWASIHFGVIGGIGTAYEGNCDTAKTWSLWLHIAINAFSSALLGASNYTMQCASAPTREECDKAHEKRDWLDIGVVSVRNLTRIDWRRRYLWIMLALSSFPIHLIYNSTVFVTLDANNYKVIVANSDFLDSTNFTMPPHIDDRDHPDIQIFRNAYVANASNFEILDNEACIDTYAKSFVSGHDDLVTIMKHAGNASVLGSFKPGFVSPNQPQSYPYDW